MNTKKIIALLMSCLMLFSIFPGAVFAEEPNYVASIGDKGYTTLQAAINAATTGDNTITLLTNIDEKVTVKQQKSINITIDGDGKTYSGTITIDGNGGYNRTETLTIKDINFKSADSKYFIDGYNEDRKNYAHNVTVDNCSFTYTGEGRSELPAMYFRSAKKITVKNSTGANLFSFLYTNSGENITVDGVTVTNCGTGLNLSSSGTITVKNSNVAADGGRAVMIGNDGTGQDMTVVFENNTLSNNSSTNPVVLLRGYAADAKVTVNATVMLGDPQMMYSSNHANNEVEVTIDGESVDHENNVWSVVSEAGKFTIRYRDMFGGHVGGTISETAVVGEEKVLKANTFKHAGYTFERWNTKSDGTGKYTYADGVTLTKSDVADLYAIANNGVATLNAIWTANTDTPYKVKHILMNTTGDKVDKAYATYSYKGTTDTLTDVEALNITGYTAMDFDQLNIEGNGSTVVEIRYKRNTHTLTYDLQGGAFTDGTASEKTVAYNATLKAPADPVRDGYTFAGWDIELPEKMPDHDITLQAMWEEIVPEECKHEYVVVNKIAATCKDPAYVWYECSICGEEMNREEGEADGEHNYEVVNKIAATCKDPAYVWYKCSVCGEEMNREEGDAADEHSGETYTVTEEANCSKEGSIKTYCKVCDDLLSEEVLPKNDTHFFFNGECQLCHAKEECKHEYEVVNKIAATCKDPAYVWYECSICGEEMNREEGEADGEHNYEVVNKIAATCKDPAYVWYKCSVCGEEMNREEGDAADEHSGETYTVTEEANCSKEGSIKTYCKTCDELLSEEVLPKNDTHFFFNGECQLCHAKEECKHEYVVVDKIAATCKDPAYVWYECSICGEEMNREEGEADGEHNYEVVKRENATCKDPAYVWYKCSVCGEEMNREEGEADGEHNYVDGVCTVCGAKADVTVEYVFTNEAGLELPAEVKELLPAAAEYSVGDVVTIPVIVTPVTVAEGTWTFEGWDIGKDGAISFNAWAEDDGVITITGKWTFTAKVVDPEQPKPEKHVKFEKFILPNLRSIVIDTTEGGKTGVASGKAVGALGSTYRLSIMPDEGFAIDEVLVNGKEVKVNKNNNISFVVKGNTYVEVSFVEIDD